MAHFDLLNYKGDENIRLANAACDAFRIAAMRHGFKAATAFGYACRLLDGEDIDGIELRAKKELTDLVRLGDYLRDHKMVNP